MSKEFDLKYIYGCFSNIEDHADDICIICYKGIATEPSEVITKQFLETRIKQIESKLQLIKDSIGYIKEEIS